MQIYERIKIERINAGLTEDQMAEKLGITRSTYQYWEKKTPAYDKIMAVARALNKPEDYFFVKYDEKNNDENFGANIAEPQEEYGKIGSEGKWGGGKDIYITALLEEKDRAIKKAEAHYEDAKADKERLFNALDKLQRSFDDTLKQISENLKETSANLKSNHDVLLAIGRTVRANDAEMMEALDHLEGNPVGTLQSKSHTVQKALREGVEAGTTDKNTGIDKIRKD